MNAGLGMVAQLVQLLHLDFLECMDVELEMLAQPVKFLYYEFEVLKCTLWLSCLSSSIKI